MREPAIPPNEQERLKELVSYSILDTLPEEEYDAITKIASGICQTPISLITLIDEKRQWFKSHHGVEVAESPRALSFCAHAILEPQKIMEVPDARQDDRFRDNPFVAGQPGVVFYAGVPLVTPGGNALGSLCVLDSKPRELSEEQKGALRSLAIQVVNLLELRRTKGRLERANAELETKNSDLEQFARVAAHDLKSPLNCMITIVDSLNDDYGASLEKEVREYLGLLKDSSARLKELIDAILKYSQCKKVLAEEKERFALDALIAEIGTLQIADAHCSLTYESCRATVETNKTALQQILMNLISNGIKYCDKENPRVEIRFVETPKQYEFSVEDNGPGISKEGQKKLFTLFTKLQNEDRYGHQGTGIGLSTVKNLVEGLGGKVTVQSEMGRGTTFSFTLLK